MPELIPAGNYRARAVDWGLATTKGGKEQVVVTFALEELEGYRITWYGHFTDKSWKRTVESLRLCGWEGEDLQDLTGLDGNEVAVVVNHETFEGNTHARVSWVNDPNRGVNIKSPLDGDGARQFAARMRDKVKTVPAHVGNGGGSAGAGGGGEPVDDSDIPF